MKEITSSVSFLLDAGVKVIWECFLALLVTIFLVKKMSLGSFVNSIYCNGKQIREILLLPWASCNGAFGESRIVLVERVSVDVTSIMYDPVLWTDLFRSVFISLVFPKVLK